jgi:hypothetical protein
MGVVYIVRSACRWRWCLKVIKGSLKICGANDREVAPPDPLTKGPSCIWLTTEDIKTHKQQQQQTSFKIVYFAKHRAGCFWQNEYIHITNEIFLPLFALFVIAHRYI